MTLSEKARETGLQHEVLPSRITIPDHPWTPNEARQARHGTIHRKVIQTSDEVHPQAQEITATTLGQHPRAQEER